MVPVRKPGRPLTSCPHAQSQPCNCGHITAAIPKKQTCRCPDDGPEPVGARIVGGGQHTIDLPTSPTVPSYRVQKASSRPPSSRKSSTFDASAFVRMGMENVNFRDNTRQSTPVTANRSLWANMDAAPWTPDQPPVQAYTVRTEGTQIPSMQDNFLINSPQGYTIVNQRTYPDGRIIYLGNRGKPLTLAEKLTGKTKEGSQVPTPQELGDIYPRTDLPLDMANDMSFSQYMADIRNAQVNSGTTNGSYLTNFKRTTAMDHMRISTGPFKVEESENTLANTPIQPVQLKAPARKSCCGPKKEGHSHSSSSASSISEPQELQLIVGDGHGPQLISQESTSSHATPPYTYSELKQAIAGQPNTAPYDSRPTAHPGYGLPISAEALPRQPTPSSLFDPIGMSNFFSSPVHFTGQSAYGSYQNPFKPDTYRQNVHFNGPPQPGNSMTTYSFDTPATQDKLETLHECCCGDECQCLGCAAHPYNTTTREYVRSAYAFEPSLANNFDAPSMANSQTGAYTPPNIQTGNMEEVGQGVLSPTSSTGGEEQVLSGDNFFFVDYPMGSGDGCGGEDVSCPCGDDCECFGCTIHKPLLMDTGIQEQQQPPLPPPKKSCCS